MSALGQWDKPDGTDDEITKTCQDSHPGFTIECEKCHSKRVYIQSTLEFSAQSGGWGNVSIICHDCKQEIDLLSV